MRFTADHAFHIGSQHLRGGLPCQDYALSFAGPDHASAVISDGCSSGGHTDIGARIAARSTRTALAWSSWNYFNENMIDRFCRSHDSFGRSALNLDQADMLATVGYVAIVKNHLCVRLIGDGVIAAKHSRGVVMTRVDWDQNMPLYRAYADDDYAGFVMAHGGDRAAEVVKVTRHARGDVAPATDKIIPQPLYAMLSGFTDRLDVRDFNFVAVFSDGVTQVDGMDWRDVVTELMSFKSAEGAFVKRRMLRFLKDCQKHGRGPIDDIAMACIHIDHEAA